MVVGDKHSAHHGPLIQALFHANGHLLLNTSVHSCDFSPTEWAFSHAVKYAQRHEEWLLTHPSEYHQVFAAGLRSHTPEYTKAFFTDSHYPVEGLPYKPYLGN